MVGLLIVLVLLFTLCSICLLFRCASFTCVVVTLCCWVVVGCVLHVFWFWVSAHGVILFRVWRWFVGFGCSWFDFSVLGGCFGCLFDLI